VRLQWQDEPPPCLNQPSEGPPWLQWRLCWKLSPREGGEVDELLGGSSHEERGDVDHLLADSDVSLSDEDTGLMDGSGKVSLDNEGLESSFHELVDGQTEHVIELSLVLVEETESDHALDEGITFENSSGIGVIHSQ